VGQLDDRVAVITGGGRGIGREIALRFASEGATVVISSRTATDLEAVLARIAQAGGASGHFVVADAMDRADARRPVTEAVERFGRVDVLVNNVGGTVGRSHDPFTGDDESFERTLVLCLTSAWWTTVASAPISGTRWRSPTTPRCISNMTTAVWSGPTRRARSTGMGR
jgi:NAD(P)-dependent dehydrogenase (short-subunit alcohol dehydrogenase family)